MTRKTKTYLGAASALAVAISLASAGGAMAQVTTSTVRGSVTDNGVAEAGATVVARDTASGFTNRTTANANGGYVLSGLRPGTYEITVTTADGQTASDVVTIGVGQVGDLDLAVGADAATGDPGAVDVGDVVIVGRRLAEVRTPENATNVTTQQINTLPQINRNFLNFAALAPGVRLSLDENEQTITAGGQRAESVNAFIDGASLKSNVIAGGIIGQDDSRGNPFPQAGIQEFRVVSQNFKAEYEQASSAIITAVTRSGTNEFHGEVFGAYRDQSFITQDSFAEDRGDEKADLEVRQYGFALGGPIIRDRLHFFGTYEKKQENRANVVDLGDRGRIPRFQTQFADFLGTFAAPFEEDLYFGKLSWQPADGHLIDWSVTYRDETDLRDFGGAEAFERANNLHQTTLTSNIRYQWQTDSFLNEFAIDYRDYNYNPGAANFSDVGQSYRIFDDTDADTLGFQPDRFGGATILNIGGRDSTQDIHDNAITVRNDLTFNDLEFNGFHTVKVGAKVSMQNYEVNKQFGRNPFFYFDVDGRPELSGSTTVPYRVELGQAFPEVDLDNTVYGLYIQDDWRITEQLELNLGLRWDYETNSNNKDYVTPANVVAGLNQYFASSNNGRPAGYVPSFFNQADYISTGNNREAYAKAFQPRFGFSYDFFGDRSTVIFGGAGRYYDRINFNFSYDELVKPFDIRKNAFFSTTGRPAGQDSDPGPGVNLPGDAGDPILWQESYRTAAGLDPVLAALPGQGEVFLLKNDFEPPRTDQVNLGIRQRLGDWQTEFTVAYGKTENEFTWLYLGRCREPTRPSLSDGGFGDSGGFCGPDGTNEFRNYFASDHNKSREFKALYVKLDKNYTEASGWGLNVAYTYSEAEQNGGRDAFCFDCFNIEDSPVRPTDNDERHRIVANGIVDLPFDFQLSGILTLGSGTPFDVFDGRGTDFVYRPNGGRPQQFNFIIPNSFAYRNLDLRLTKKFEVFEGQELSLFVDAINVFNFDNFAGFDGGTTLDDGRPTERPNPNFERPSRVLFPTRTFQIGMRYSF